ALQGAIYGPFIGLLSSMLSGNQDMVMALGSTEVMAGGIWVLFSVISEVTSRKQLKFMMPPTTSAVSFDLVVNNAVADQVTSALGPQPMGQHQSSVPANVPSEQPKQADASEPSHGGIPDLPDGRPQFGVRVDEQPDQDSDDDSDDTSEQR